MTDLDHLRYAAKVAATQSHDPKTQNAAVLVARNSTIWSANRVPKGIEVTPASLEAPRKYVVMEHAERGVIQAAARIGWKTDGSTMYCLWFACVDCARAIINAGIGEIVGHMTPRSQTPDRWIEQVAAGEAMLRQAGVSMRWMNETLGVTIRFDGRELEL